MPKNAKHPLIGGATPGKRIEKFLQWTREFEGKNMLYRGLSSNSYGITASITRRIQGKDWQVPIPHELFTLETERLISEARMRGYGYKQGKKLSDLELLAELQHFDAATCLFDFTSNPLVALWFACKPNENKEDSSQGAVIALGIDDGSTCYQINDPEKIEQGKIGEMLAPGGDYRKDDNMLCIWAPHHQNERIIAQQSVFVFGKPEIDNLLGARRISKKGVHKELEKLGISADSLYCDFHGFARNNKQNIPTSENHFETAERYLQKQDYDIAIGYYGLEINKNPSHRAAYYGRARAYYAKEDYLSTIKDLDKFIRAGTKDGYAFFMRGIAKGRLGKHKEAIKDYDKVIRLNPQHANAFYNRGTAKLQLGKPQDAIKDLDEAVRIKPQYANALHNRGVAKALLGNLQDAVKDYDEAILINPKNANTFYGRSVSKFRLGDNHGAWEDAQTAKRLNPNLEIPKEITPPKKGGKK